MTTKALDNNSLQLFKLFQNPQFKVRVIMRMSKPWFVAKDVADCIEHKDVSTMCKLCRDKDKVVASASNFDSADLAESGNSRITLISESGLYRILGKCNLPKCEPFESWVFDEVLPSIRKNGIYATQDVIQKAISDPDWMISLLQQLKKANRDKEIAERGEQIALKKLEWAEKEKKFIGSKREATCMQEVARARRIANYFEKQNVSLAEENIKLKEEIQGKTWRTTRDFRKEWIRRFGHKPSAKRLIAISKVLGEGYEPQKNIRITTEHDSWLINSYHTKAWRIYEQEEVELLKHSLA